MFNKEGDVKPNDEVKGAQLSCLEKAEAT